ncbi:MAG: hypothetical protein JSS69_11015 [Acidobacteria bacterium]|nr:hypothetical protein [Acidobacteriota bacterium]MBS1866433.1 hypothetical protein [Acidobacteriota bacterium]
MARTKTKPVGRTPTKRKACELWLLSQLANGPSLAREILVLGVGSGWGWATVRRAKLNIGAQSFRKAEEWWWFDPKKFDPKKDSLPQQSTQAQKEAIALAQATKNVLESAPPISPAQTQPNIQPSTAFPVLLPVTSVPTKAAQENSSIPSESAQPLASSPPKKVPLPAIVPQAPKPEIPKPPNPPRHRPFHIWDSALTETRDALISSAGFADLYTMRLDIRFRQEQLRARGLLKEEAALNELLARINEALEKKKKAANLE